MRLEKKKNLLMLGLTQACLGAAGEYYLAAWYSCAHSWYSSSEMSFLASTSVLSPSLA